MYMPYDYQVPLSSVLLTIGRAIELVDPKLRLHHEKVAWISLCISETLGLSVPECRRIIHAAMVHDIAAIHIASPCWKRSDQFSVFDHHANLGSRLLATCSVLKPLAPIIRYHHFSRDEFENDIDNEVRRAAQIINIADFIIDHITHNAYTQELKEVMINSLQKLGGHKFDADIMACVLDLLKCEAFWLQAAPYYETDLMQQLNARYNGNCLGWAELSQLSHFFSFVIDMRSPFTASHSASVACMVSLLAHYAGFSEQEVDEIHVAGCFHDVGKVAVPTAILDKPGPLSPDERLIMNGHTYFTRYILKPLPGCDKIISWAADHHETLNGEGYPYRFSGDQLSAGARLMAVADIFTALLEDRPYREGMKKEKVVSILRGAASNKKISSQYVELALDNYDVLSQRLKETEAQSRQKFFEFWNEDSVTVQPYNLAQIQPLQRQMQ